MKDGVPIPLSYYLIMVGLMFGSQVGFDNARILA